MKYGRARLPFTIMQNLGREKESLKGASGFAEVELKLSPNTACVEGLAYLLIHGNILYKLLECYFVIYRLLIPHNKGFGTIVWLSRYLISTVKQLLKVKFCDLNRWKRAHFQSQF